MLIPPTYCRSPSEWFTGRTPDLMELKTQGILTLAGSRRMRWDFSALCRSTSYDEAKIALSAWQSDRQKWCDIFEANGEVYTPHATCEFIPNEVRSKNAGVPLHLPRFEKGLVRSDIHASGYRVINRMSLGRSTQIMFGEQSNPSQSISAYRLDCSRSFLLARLPRHQQLGFRWSSGFLVSGCSASMTIP